MEKRIRCFLTLLLIHLLSACSKTSPEDELIKFIQKTEFTVPIALMEIRGAFYSSQWYSVTVYFGYGDDGNITTCQEHADSMNSKEGTQKYRCRVLE